MTRRRGKGEGSIRHRADGRFEVRVNLGRGLDGKRRQKSVFTQTEKAAIGALKKLHARTVSGHVLGTSTPTVAQFLEEWFTTNRDDWRPSTQRAYRGSIDAYLVPAFGSLRLEHLTPRHVQTWLTEHKTQHGPRRRITLAHAALRSALSAAMRLQLVALNAAALVKVPVPPRRPVAPLSVEQAQTFIEHARQHRLGPLFSVALACGLRLGEATGLRWEDVDLDTGELHIREQLQRVGRSLVLSPLKTAKSRRTLLLPEACIRELRAHRVKQNEERLKAGKRWTDTGLVFSTYAVYGEGKGTGKRVGSGLHPRNVLRVLHALTKAAGLPRCRFHDLRHSAASILLASGVQLAEVSKVLGHSELRLTADLYAHLQRETAVKAVRVMNGVLGR